MIVITGQRGTGKTTYIKNRLPVFDRVIVFDLLGEFDPNVFTMQRFLEKLSENKKEKFFVLSYFNPKTTDEDFERICKAVNRLNDVLFVVDELDYFTSAVSSPPAFSEIIKRGRHQEIGVACATRRPHEIPRLVTSQVTELVTFRHVEPRDLAYLKDICGLDPERVQSLPDFSYLQWSAAGIKEGKTRKTKTVVCGLSDDPGQADDFEKMFKNVGEGEIL